METETRQTNYMIGIFGAVFIMLGTIFPTMFAITLQPKQPAWESATIFVENYHGIQNLPFYFGYLLIGGSIMLLLAIHRLSSTPSLSLLGLLSGVLGSAVVSINYIIQTTYIPAIAAGYTDEYSVMIHAFSMANPTSIAWALEMWGYGFLGVGTWLCANFFSKPGLEGFARVLYKLNGILSMVGALWTSFDLGWVLTPPGYVSFGIWNLLYLVLAAVSVRIFVQRKKTS